MRRALVLLLLLWTACDDEAPGSPLDAGPPFVPFDAAAAVVPTPAQLEGGEFRLAIARNHRVLNDVPVTLRFERGEVWLAAGCDRQTGAFTVEADRLVVPSLLSTQAYCVPEHLNVQDTWFAEFLAARPRILLAHEWLTLENGDVRFTFYDRERADPDRPLVDTRWVINGFLRSGKESAYATSRLLRLVFHGSGVFELDTPCNSGTGTYVVIGATLTPSEVHFSDLPCSDGERHLDLHLRKLFDGQALTLAIEGSSLTLHHDGTLGLRAFAQ